MHNSGKGVNSKLKSTKKGKGRPSDEEIKIRREICLNILKCYNFRIGKKQFIALCETKFAKHEIHNVLNNRVSRKKEFEFFEETVSKKYNETLEFVRDDVVMPKPYRKIVKKGKTYQHHIGRVYISLKGNSCLVYSKEADYDSDAVSSYKSFKKRFFPEIIKYSYKDEVIGKTPDENDYDVRGDHKVSEETPKDESANLSLNQIPDATVGSKVRKAKTMYVKKNTLLKCLILFDKEYYDDKAYNDMADFFYGNSFVSTFDEDFNETKNDPVLGVEKIMGGIYLISEYGQRESFYRLLHYFLFNERVAKEKKPF